MNRALLPIVLLAFILTFSLTIPAFASEHDDSTDNNYDDDRYDDDRYDDDRYDDEFEIKIPRGAFSPQCASSNTCFIPNTLQVPSGSIVEWENEDRAAHTIVSGEGFGTETGFFESGILNHDEEYYVDFSNFDAGAYPYFCSLHPWMKGTIIVGLDSDVTPQALSTADDDYDDSLDDDIDDSPMMSIEETQQMKKHHKSELLPSQRALGDYMLQVNWIGEFPVTNEINGFELIVTDSKKVKMMMSHGDNGMGGGCGGGHGEHGDKGKHGSHSEHGDKGKHGKGGGMGGHEGGCPHFKMVKKSLPKVAALESGVENLENSLKMEILVQGNAYPIQLIEDNAFTGRYYVLFIPTVAAQYDVHVSGTIENTPVDFTFNPTKVIDKNSIKQIP